MGAHVLLLRSLVDVYSSSRNGATLNWWAVSGKLQEADDRLLLVCSCGLMLMADTTAQVQLYELFCSLASVSQWASDHIFILTQSLWLALFCFFFSRCWRLMPPPVSVSAWCSGPTGMSRSPASWGPLWLGRTWGSSWALTSWRPMGWRSTTKRRSSTSQMGALEKLRDVTMTVLADTWVGSPYTCAAVSGWLTALHLCSISEWRKLFNYGTSKKRDTCSGTEPRHWSALSSSKGNNFYVAFRLAAILTDTSRCSLW